MAVHSMSQSHYFPVNDTELHQKATHKEQNGYKGSRNRQNEILKMGNSFFGWANPHSPCIWGSHYQILNKPRNKSLNSHNQPTDNCTLPAPPHIRALPRDNIRFLLFFHSKRVSLPQSLQSGFGLGSFGTLIIFTPKKERIKVVLDKAADNLADSWGRFWHEINKENVCKHSHSWDTFMNMLNVLIIVPYLARGLPVMSTALWAAFFP